MESSPIAPDYTGACVANILPALFGNTARHENWFPLEARDAEQYVLLVLDGLGYEQLERRRLLAPTLSSMVRSRLTTVAPSTTASALTSITTGLPPSEHGVVGYEMMVDGELLNCLSWRTAHGDARRSLRPDQIQPYPGFLGHRPIVLTKREFAHTGFTDAMLRDGEFVGWTAASSLVAKILASIEDAEPFVYGYYDGIDKVSHADGLGVAFDLELQFTDLLVEQLLDRLPAEVTLLITADHGQVQVGDGVRVIDQQILDIIWAFSGEGRFRWHHSDEPGGLFSICEELYGDEAWVCTREQVLDEQWLGPTMAKHIVERLGDVAVVAREDVAYEHPSRERAFLLRGRHGSLTSAEMMVPLLYSRGRA
ncbi:MAG: alkaline phosphatase family protein [Acidimicrobiales bacterium]